MQILCRGKGNRVHHGIERAPLRTHGLEHAFQRAFLAQVHRHEQFRGHAQLLGQRLHMRPGLVIQIGQRQLGTQAAHGCRAAVGDGTGIGHTQDQDALAIQANGGGVEAVFGQVVQIHGVLLRYVAMQQS